ncbi:Uncharacterised protein [Staphylococcus caeli]|uniref:Uncharacterized protein n=1 Tax=Staphylococcus caeli TaxID=2201815 RepID=A0A1D4QJH7_9STAP|nr:Uncharacterised protein [Staphylococcus caeli]SCT59578.1 Uncharacterised protein [Staphylococcus caeli]
MYLEYWKNILNYKGVAKLSHLVINILINIFILFLIMISGIFVPFKWENIVVDIYYFILCVMFLPTISMIVRVINNYRLKSKN